MHNHHLREALSTGPLVGTFLKLPRFEIVELLKQAGYDFAACDYEHAQMSPSDVCDVIRAGAAAGLPVTVRIPELNRGEINRFLEAGAAGIQLARTRGDLGSGLADLVRYPPDGSRSVSLAQPAAGYGQMPLTDYLRSSNDSVMAIGQFETADYADGLDLAMKHLDVAFIGPVDLSVDLRTPGTLDSPPMTTAIQTIETAAHRAGTVLGTFAATTEAVNAAKQRGYRYIVYSSDLAMLAAGAGR
jgi:2-keto-3-deoxy-L-rhamnonate aldolase RhmA